jgi:hypothetical protein
MGVWLNTFRTEHKNATLPNGETVKVYAYKFLCRAGDEDDGIWSRGGRRAGLLQSQMSTAVEKFFELKPTYAASVYNDEWNGLVVRKGLKGAIWYDTEDFATETVGFLEKIGRSWHVVDRQLQEDYPMIAGHTFTRQYTERVVDGKIVRTTNFYRFQATGVQMTEAQMVEWQATAVPEYVASCEANQAKLNRLADEAAAARKAKLDAKDKEIAAARDRLNQLTLERSSL